MKSKLIVTALVLLYTARICSCNNDKESKRPYRVFRFVPDSLEALQFADSLYRSAADYKLDFWKAPKGIGIFVDVMVPPKFIDIFPELLTKNNISYTVTIPDVAKLIEEREKPTRPDSRPTFFDSLASFFRSRRHDERSMKAPFTFGDYSSYTEITNWLKAIASNYPTFTKTFKIGTTTEGRAIEGIKIGSPISSRDKKVVWIDGGIHAREWTAVHTALYIINELVSKYGDDPTITNYVNSVNFYIVPCLNPDGYEYSRVDSGIPEQRMWRKNRSKAVCTRNIWGNRVCCGGVDLNRNFGFHWGESGSSDDPCSEVYQGSKEFSEPETRALRDMLLSPELFGKTEAYITFHAYAQMWMYPFGHQLNQVPDDVNDLRSVGREAVNALKSVYGTRYQLGTGPEMLYPSSGGSDDWAKEYAKIKYTFLLELRPEFAAVDGFLLDKKELIPTGKETWAGVRKVVDAVIRRNLLRNDHNNHKGSAGVLRQHQSTTRKPSTTARWTTVNWRSRSQQRRSWRITPTWSTRRPWTWSTRKPRTVATAAMRKTTTPSTIKATTKILITPPTTTTIAAKPMNAPTTTTASAKTVTSLPSSTTAPSNISEKSAHPMEQTEDVKSKNQPVCENRRGACDIWLTDNPLLCKASFRMKTQCAKSCGVCKST